MNTNIIVNLQVEGFHNWPDAPSEVAFLRAPHRHIFHICCKKHVTHNDRDIEIILFKRKVLKYLLDKYLLAGIDVNVCNFNTMSCEMIATELTNQFNLEYCSVLEDGENGAEVMHDTPYTGPIQYKHYSITY